MSQKITVVGSLNIDLILQAPRLPTPGETILGAQNLMTVPGGKGANQAVAAARLGAEVAMIGRVGADDFGRQLLASLQEANVDTQPVTVTEAVATGAAMIIVDANGQNSIVVSPGANGLTSVEDIERHADVIRNSNVLLLQLEIPLDTVAFAAKVAAEADVRVMLNPAPALPLPGNLLNNVDVLVLNETEAALLTLQPVASEQDIRMTLMMLQRLGVETLALTQGAAGVTVAAGDLVTHVPAFSIDVVDTTAAGDAFSAAFAVALAEGRTPQQAARFGNAAGALAAAAFGAQPSLPTLDAVLHLLNPKC